ncbi:MAG: hypothetical protein ACMUEM_04085 [Flavobacteriales bacterium AspAUS03]
MEAIKVMYEVIDASIGTLISMKNFPYHLILFIGWIMINGNPEMGSFLTFKYFNLIKNKLLETKSILNH